VAEARRRRAAARDDPQPRLVRAVGDRRRPVDDTAPAEAAEHRVVERGRAREVGDLEADVIDHGRGL
jgi:hypothetical protein